jgi:hypothetical protein
MPELNQDQLQLQQLEALRQRTEEANEKEVQSLISQIKESRQEIETNLAKLGGLADELRTRSRRIANDSSASHVIFATAHLRFAGAAAQGIKRTVAMDRMLDRAQAGIEEARRREEQETRWRAERAARKKVEELVQPNEDAFDELYGEVVPNA